MSETHRIFRIKGIKPFPSHAVNLLILCGDRLTAAADTAAGTSHDLYKIILHLAFSRSISLRALPRPLTTAQRTGIPATV